MGIAADANLTLLVHRPVVDEFLQTLSINPQMARFSVGMNLERWKRNRPLTLDFIGAA
jgi:hypothetical protein